MELASKYPTVAMAQMSEPNQQPVLPSWVLGVPLRLCSWLPSAPSWPHVAPLGGVGTHLAQLSPVRGSALASLLRGSHQLTRPFCRACGTSVAVLCTFTPLVVTLLQRQTRVDWSPV